MRLAALLVTLALYLSILSAGQAQTAAKPAETKPAPVLYDEKADANVQIKAALADAQKTNRRVLLQFGANWCGWCHKLHHLFESDKAIADTLKQNFVCVLVDVNKGHNQDVDKRYGSPTKHGLPVLVVLDKDGKNLFTQDTGLLEIEGTRHDPKKVLAFLRTWMPQK